ncbi:MAG: hypothetical protein AB7K24_14265 [Gemmataceae bacterium]
MPISFNCPACGHPYQVPDEVGGRSTKCRQCSAEMLIPLAGLVSEPEIPTVDYQHEPAPPVALAAEQPPPAYQARLDPMDRLRQLPPKVLMATAGVALLLFCLLPTFLVARWLFGGSALGTFEKYLPDNCKLIAVIQFQQLLDSSLFNQAKVAAPPMRELADDPFAKKIEQMILAADDFETRPFFLVKTREPASADDFKKTLKDAPEFVEEKIEGITLYRYGSPIKDQAFCIPEKHLVVQGDADKLRAILKRRKKPELSDELQAALAQVDLSATIAVAFSLKGVSLPENPGPFNVGKLAKPIEYASAQVNLTKEDFEAGATVHCAEGKAATELADFIKGIVTLTRSVPQLPKEVSELLGTVKIEPSNTDVVMTLSCTQDALFQAIMAFNVFGARARR